MNLYESIKKNLKESVNEEDLKNALFNGLDQEGKSYINKYTGDIEYQKGKDYFRLTDMSNNSAANDTTYEIYFDAKEPLNTSKWKIMKKRGNNLVGYYDEPKELTFNEFAKVISSLYRRRNK